MFVPVEERDWVSIRYLIKKVLINIETSAGLASKASNASGLLLLKILVCINYIRTY